jgi:hypothetical protein
LHAGGTGIPQHQEYGDGDERHADQHPHRLDLFARILAGREPQHRDEPCEAGAVEETDQCIDHDGRSPIASNLVARSDPCEWILAKPWPG